MRPVVVVVVFLNYCILTKSNLYESSDELTKYIENKGQSLAEAQTLMKYALERLNVEKGPFTWDSHEVNGRIMRIARMLSDSSIFWNKNRNRARGAYGEESNSGKESEETDEDSLTDEYPDFD